MSRLTINGSSIAVETPFDRDFVESLKTLVPYADRKWDKQAKLWLISPSYAQPVANLIHGHFGETVTIPTITTTATPIMRMVQLMYLGRTKERGQGVYTATGYSDGAWSLSFPEKVLKQWFGLEGLEPDAPAPPPDSLYAVLGLKQFSEAQDIKAAYKRLAKVTHPDVCKEPDATERFRALQHAYELLKDDKQRRKYDVGLILQQRAAQAQPQRRAVSFAGDYRAPLTCGLLFVEGIERLSVLDVSKIHRWDDIVNTAGQTMTSYWLAGDDTFTVRWV